MRSSNFLKLSGAVLVVAFLALIGFHGNTLAQDAATPAATTGVVEGAATAAGPMRFPPCPPEKPSAATAATAATVSDAGAAGVATLRITQLAGPLTQGAVGAATGAATVATVSATTPGYIGMRVVPVDNCGVRILEVLPNTPAMTAQLIVQDVIVAVDGVAISGTKALRDLLSTTQAGDTIKLTIQRAGAEMDIEVTLGTRPAEAPVTVPATVAATTSAGGGSLPATAAPTMAATQ